MTTARSFIAEAGVNHNGSLDAGAAAGRRRRRRRRRRRQVPDLQGRAARDRARAPRPTTRSRNTGEGGSQLEMLRRLELSPARPRRRCSRAAASAASASCRPPSTRRAWPSWRAGHAGASRSRRATSPARRCCCRRRGCGKPLIVSTGMCTLADIEEALGVIAFGLTRDGEPRGRADFEAAYAAPKGRAALRAAGHAAALRDAVPGAAEAVNLRAMDTLAAPSACRSATPTTRSASTVAIAAVARGATVIEKHFTLDRSLPGPDHAASLEPDELSRTGALASAGRAARSVRRSRRRRRRSWATARWPAAASSRRARSRAGETARAGTRWTCKRPGTGISPMRLWDLVGRAGAPRDYAVDEPIEP